MYIGCHINDDEYLESNILEMIKDGESRGANNVQIFLRNPNNTKKVTGTKFNDV